MKYSKTKKLKDIELRKKLTEQQEKLRLFRFSIAGGKAKNVKESRNTRRDIARLLTEINLRQRVNQGK